MKKQGQSFYRRRSPAGAVQKIAVYNLLPKARILSDLENGTHHFIAALSLLLPFYFGPYPMQKISVYNSCLPSPDSIPFVKWNPSIQMGASEQTYYQLKSKGCQHLIWLRLPWKQLEAQVKYNTYFFKNDLCQCVLYFDWPLSCFQANFNWIRCWHPFDFNW